VGLRVGLEGRNVSSALGFDPEPPARSSVAIPTELHGNENNVPNTKDKRKFFWTVRKSALEVNTDHTKYTYISREQYFFFYFTPWP